MAKNNKIANDATASVSGTIYQICVALERAFMLEEGQKIWIEKFGDVTVSGQVQIESKQYSDSLTDSHPNFWKTIRNWLNISFKSQNYTSLVLFTTQAIGATSKLQGWNEANKNDRLKILRNILKSSEERLKQSVNSKVETQATEKLSIAPSESLLDQRYVLAPEQLPRLEEIISKICISSDSPGIVGLRKKIIDQHGKTILHAKKEEFLDNLMGFLINPALIENGWEITFDDFSQKLTSVSNLYRRGTVIFPVKNIEPSPEEIQSQSDKLFVQKLREIKYDDVIQEAMRHYIFANSTIFEEFKNYEVDPLSYQTYQANLRQSHQAKHRLAKRNLSGNQFIASQNFYDNLTGETPQPFPSFEQTPMEFRNGVFHMLADDESGEFNWKLWS